MQNSLLVDVYRAFDASELKKLDKFLASPYFNESQLIIDLHKYLAAKHPNFHETTMKKEKVYAHLYPGEPYDDKKLRYFRTRLLKQIEKLFAVQKLESDEDQLRQNLIATLRKRKMEKLFFRNVKSLDDKLEGSQVRDGDYYFNKFRLNEEKNRFYTQSSGKYSRSLNSNLQETIDNLDTYYLINKLKYFCTTLNYENILSFQHKNLLFNEILQHLEENDYEETPAISIYYHILKSLMDFEEPSHFERLRKLLDKNAHKFSQEEIREMYVFAQNYCIRKINAGETDFLQKLFDLYKQGLKNEVIFDDGHITPWTYKNITVLGLRLGEFEWVKNFIEEYKTKLPAKEKENAYVYNLAKYHFYRKDYSQVISLLMTVEYNDVFYGLDSKAMLLKTYFELDETEALDSICDSFRIFLKRKKAISDHHRVTYNNLIKFAKRLSKTIPGDKKKISGIEKKIKETKQIADINWLMEKVEELK